MNKITKKAELLTGDIIVDCADRRMMVLRGTGQGDICVTIADDGVKTTWYPLSAVRGSTLEEASKHEPYGWRKVYRPRTNMAYSKSMTAALIAADYTLLWAHQSESPRQKELREIENKLAELQKKAAAIREQL